jgi:hypothetical protein
MGSESMGGKPYLIELWKVCPSLGNNPKKSRDLMANPGSRPQDSEIV